MAAIWDMTTFSAVRTGAWLHPRHLTSMPAYLPPLVSVVIPCYNYGRYLYDCVGSVTSQLGVQLEVIIVDDASVDNSLSIANAIANVDSRVRVIGHVANKGHISSYNDGLSEAKGDYLVLLSADDLLAPGHLLRATRLLEHCQEVGFVYGPTMSFIEEAPVTAASQCEKFKTWRGPSWLARRCMRVRNCVISPEVVMRRSVYERVGPYRTDLPHIGDFAMWLLSAAIADVGYIDGPPAAYYRKHGSNMHLAMFKSGQVDGMLIDLRQRRRAFEIVFEGAGGDLPNSYQLCSMAMKQLAAESLAAVCRAYTWGLTKEWPCEDLTAFAQETWPRYERLPQWRALRRRRRLGIRASRKCPPFVATEIALRIRETWTRQREIRFGA